MALYQPSYLQPRNSTIDANVAEEMEFSCKLNGNSILYGYDIFIYDIDTNEEVFRLTSDTSKNLLQKELTAEQSKLSKAKTDITTRENLLKEVTNDNTATNYQTQLNEIRIECEERLVQMSSYINGTTTEQQQFFVLGDLIIRDMNDCRNNLAPKVKTKIENHYLTIISDFQKRLDNNKIQLDINIERYGKNKEANEVSEKTVKLLKKILDYVTSNTSDIDTSTKRIVVEYWGRITRTLQEQIDDLKKLQKETETQIKYLQTAINNLSKGMFVLSEPLYPVDYLGNNVTLVHKLPVGALKNGNNYKWKIQLFWSSTENKEKLDKSIDSQECYFECRTTPTISISNYSKKITKKHYEFIGEYNQKEHVPVTYFRWVLTQTITGEILKDTGYIPSPDIRFYYDGFLNEYQYSIKLYVRNQNEIEVETEEMKFKVAYVSVPVDNVVVAKSNTEEHGIVVNWSAVHGVSAKVYGDYSFEKDIPTMAHNSLVLPKGSSLVFDKDNDEKLKVPVLATHIISIRIDDPNIGVIYEATGINGGMPYYKRLTLEGNELVYDINGIKEYRWTIVPTKMHWYIIFMLPDKLIVSNKWASGLFPRYGIIDTQDEVDQIREDDLVPYIGLYPRPLLYHNTEGEEII